MTSADQADILLERRELLVRQRHFAGGAHAYAVRGVEPELGGRRVDRATASSPGWSAP